MSRSWMIPLLLISMKTSLLAAEPEFRLLWPDGAPGATGETDADKPGVWIYPATEKPNGTAIVICPGGGYVIHATDHEGVQPARYFNSIGVTAFVLRYRLSPYRHPIPLQDAQRALRFVRANSKQFGVDPHRVGIMGFSAGGHLTSTAMTHFDSGTPKAADVVEQQSCRPDFGILGYPVVSFVADYAHRGSANNLLGASPAEEQLQELSNDTKVTAETPPAFLFHTAEDTGVPVQNSIAFFMACQKMGVPAELHVYQQGPHGVGLANEHPALSQWVGQSGTWLRQNGLLTSGKRQAVKGQITLNGEPLKFGTVALVPESTSDPVGWAMVRNGSFSMPAASGPIVGNCRVYVTDMGAVAPQPTVDDARQVGKGAMITAIAEGENVVDIRIVE